MTSDIVLIKFSLCTVLRHFKILILEIVTTFITQYSPPVSTYTQASYIDLQTNGRDVIHHCRNILKSKQKTSLANYDNTEGDQTSLSFVTGLESLRL